MQAFKLLKDSDLEPKATAGTTVYDISGWDCGLASDDTQGGLMLCDRCTKICDDLPIEGALTRAQVEKALDLPFGPDHA